MKRAVVLLSGGLDSATTLAIARDQEFETYALSFDYNQRHRIEIEAARRIARLLGAHEHRIAAIDLRVFGGSALTAKIDVPKDRLSDNEFGATREASTASSFRPTDVPITYVPARNTIFLSYALAWAEVLDATDIFIGVNAVDYSGYPDCRPRFLAQFEKLAALATRAGMEGKELKIHAPLIAMSKAEIIAAASKLGVDLGLTHSCYDPLPNGLACGHCDSCLLRRRGFTEAGLIDPILYAA